METLRTVRDIWKQTGHIDEIHVELGREMKNPAEKRRKLTQQIQETKTPICVSRHFLLNLPIQNLELRTYARTLQASKIYCVYMKKKL